jgi:ppGpp synthetase/RelA/SpoT-type nucleotidyltranferase
MFTARFLARAKEHKERTFRGLPIVIENPKGSIREGADPSGKAWKREMQADYGFIEDTTGTGDKENIDVYVGDDESSPNAYVIEQLGLGVEPDEYKVVLGAPDLQSAEELYLKHYEPGWEEEHVGEISEVPLEELFSAVKEHQEQAKQGSEDWKCPVCGRLNPAVHPRCEECAEANPAGPLAKKPVAPRKQHANGWIDKVLESESLRGRDAGIERGRNIVRSLSLGRDFGEANEDYEARRPDIGEFMQWFDAYQNGKTAADSDLVDKFVAQYARQRGVYGKAADVVRKEIAAACEANGIRAAITSRAKEVESLRKKLVKRNVLRPYRDFKDIRTDIKDMAGVRVALYFPIDREPVGQIIQKLYEQARPPKRFPEDRGPGDGDDYEATHYAIKYAGLVVEIQVASALMLSWSECAHDLLYKPKMGEVTPAERQLLKELKDIVKAGEHTVTQLQETVMNRLASIPSEAQRVAARLYATTILSRRDEILAGI